ncbi:MAG: hypothetical protein FVQ84_19710 [Planctomycetes bacterium]|nr:hypothetical protein [Planctomycetota bacterium]
MKASKFCCLVLAIAFLSFGCNKKPAETKKREKPSEQTILLCNAAEEGNIEKVKSLIASGADVNSKSKYGDTPLHYAAKHGHKLVAELLIESGAEVNAKNKLSETPLHLAAENGYKDVVKALIAGGADVNAEAGYRGTPLHKAAFYGHRDVAELLVAAGTDINVSRPDGLTSLHVALQFRWRDPNVAKVLVANEADVNAQDKYGGTPLHYAASLGYKDVTKLLIAKGADINARRINGETPLHEAALQVGMNIIQLLIDKGADVNAKNSLSETPLHYAARHGCGDAVEVLVANGADVSAITPGGYTPLHFAVSHGQKNIAELLIANGGDTDARTSSGRTPLFSAALRGRRDIVYLLIANGADTNAKMLSGWRPLHYAARQGHINVAELLIANSADVNAKDNNGQTPLHKAASRGYYNLADLLVEEGADVNAEDNDGMAVQECARAAGHNDVVELLKGNRAKVNTTDWYDQKIVVGRVQKAAAKSLTDTDSLVLSNSTFAFDLYRQLCSLEGNLFFSPYSISTALALAYAGARGNTEKQMAQTLHFSLDQKSIHPVFAELQVVLNQIQKDGNIKLCIANSLWPQQDYKFLNEYLSLVKRSYGAYITGVDYINARQTACKLINEWVENKTEDRIKDLVQPESLDELTLLVLVNAIYFKGNWESPFDVSKTKDVNFYVSSKKSVQIPMMHQTEKFRYAEFRTLQIIELPYIGDSLSMLLILPKRIDGLGQIENSLSVENIEFWRQCLDKREVNISIPKFKMSRELLLVNMLKALGMDDAFIYQQANFAGMDGRDNWLFIGGVIHKAFIEVNEEGTEAAAATAVGMLGGAPPTPPVFRADHPFLFLIQEKQTGSILFIGRVTDPTKSGQ